VNGVDVGLHGNRFSPLGDWGCKNTSFRGLTKNAWQGKITLPYHHIEVVLGLFFASYLLLNATYFENIWSFVHKLCCYLYGSRAHAIDCAYLDPDPSGWPDYLISCESRSLGRYDMSGKYEAN
jgi:hypothetical protein